MTAQAEESRVLQRGSEVISIAASTIMLTARTYKDNPKCRKAKHVIWFCEKCGYNHCPDCRCNRDCYCEVEGCSTWEKCGLNEAYFFLMNTLPGLTLEQAQGLMDGSLKLGGQSASSTRPDDTIYLYEHKSSFIEDMITKLNTWGSSREEGDQA